MFEIQTEATCSGVPPFFLSCFTQGLLAIPMVAFIIYNMIVVNPLNIYSLGFSVTIIFIYSIVLVRICVRISPITFIIPVIPI